MSWEHCNLLLDGGLPEMWNGLPVYGDYRNMVRFEQALSDETLSAAQKAKIGTQQLFDVVPKDAQQAAQMLAYLLWFYKCGRSADDDSGNAARRPERAYDFAQDSGYILAAFWQAYGIDLVHIPFLHWWQFMALLESLPESTRMAQLMAYRTMDTAKIKDAQQRKYYEDLKQRFSLAKAVRQKSVEELNAETHTRVQRRFASAKKAVESKG